MEEGCLVHTLTVGKGYFSGWAAFPAEGGWATQSLKDPEAEVVAVNALLCEATLAPVPGLLPLKCRLREFRT